MAFNAGRRPDIAPLPAMGDAAGEAPAAAGDDAAEAPADGELPGDAPAPGELWVVVVVVLELLLPPEQATSDNAASAASTKESDFDRIETPLDEGICTGFMPSIAPL